MIKRGVVRSQRGHLLQRPMLGTEALLDCVQLCGGRHLKPEVEGEEEAVLLLYDDRSVRVSYATAPQTRRAVCRGATSASTVRVLECSGKFLMDEVRGMGLVWDVGPGCPPPHARGGDSLQTCN